jgi:hypothetical protein
MFDPVTRSLTLTACVIVILIGLLPAVEAGIHAA